ncbi:transposase [Symbiopectobacterium sp. RP]|uniref:transposase n=1 Tax=Symbiopectobacterium sp. RP TaxID=3248553 RepID=UPI003D295B75
MRGSVVSLGCQHKIYLFNKAPVLPKNRVIVMDNATFHKKHNIQQVIIDAGYMVEDLPTYSPDLNPIEHKWAQAKSKKRESGWSLYTRLCNCLILICSIQHQKQVIAKRHYFDNN